LPARDPHHGQSGQLDAIVNGEDSPERLADLALASFAADPTTQLALTVALVIITDSDSLLRQYRFLEAEIRRSTPRLKQFGEQHQELADAGARWITVQVSSVQPDSGCRDRVRHDSLPSGTPGKSRAGVSRKHERRQRLSGKDCKGSPWLRRMACQSAWAAVRTKNCYLSAQFKRLAARRGSKRALLAVAHSLLVIGYHLQSKGCVYQELGGNYFDQLHEERLKRHLVKRLESLGVGVTLQTQAR
jgi:hypothetical protein